MFDLIYHVAVISVCVMSLPVLVFYVIRPYLIEAGKLGWPGKMSENIPVSKQVSVSEHELEHLVYSGLETGGEVIYGAFWDEDTFKEKHGGDCEKCYPKQTLQQMKESSDYLARKGRAKKEAERTKAKEQGHRMCWLCGHDTNTWDTPSNKTHLCDDCDWNEDEHEHTWSSQTITYQRTDTPGSGYKTPGGVRFTYRVDDQNRTIVNYGDGDKQLTIGPRGPIPVIDTKIVAEIVEVTNRYNKGLLSESLGAAWAQILGLYDQKTIEDITVDELLGGTSTVPIASISDTTPRKAPKIPIMMKRELL